MVIISAHLSDILHNLQNVVKKLNQSGKVNFPVVIQVADTKGRIDQKLRNGYLAYDQIQTRSIQLYSKGNTTHDLFTMTEQLPVEEHHIQARDYYGHAYLLAQQFLSGARSFQDKDRNATAFMLNISAGQAYEALMVVHILRYPLGRPLNDLRELAESLHPELSMIWPGLQGEQIIKSLTTAFRDARFSSEYRITDSELNMMFGYVEDLHKLISYICQIKLDTLKAGSLNKPKRDWLEVVAQALQQSEASLYSNGDGQGISGESQNSSLNISPIIRTVAQEEALAKLRATVFDLEEPCYEMVNLGAVLKSMSYGDDDAEQGGIFVMGRVVQERALVIKDIFTQMLGLLKQSRLRDDTPIKRKANTELKTKKLGL